MPLQQTPRPFHGLMHVLFLIGLLCVSITLQILGSPLSFWHPDGSSDLIESSLLEGLAIISSTPIVSPVFQGVFAFEAPSPTYQFTTQHQCFHPPLPMV